MYVAFQREVLKFLTVWEEEGLHMCDWCRLIVCWLFGDALSLLMWKKNKLDLYELSYTCGLSSSGSYLIFVCDTVLYHSTSPTAYTTWKACREKAPAPSMEVHVHLLRKTWTCYENTFFMVVWSGAMIFLFSWNGVFDLCCWFKASSRGRTWKHTGEVEIHVVLLLNHRP